jgi:phosphate-selective porin
MNFNRTLSRRKAVAVIALLFSAVVTQAQTSSQPAGVGGSQPAAPSAPGRKEDEKEDKQPGPSHEAKTAEEVEQLKLKLEQLQLLVEQQQRAIAEMQKRVEEVESRSQAAAAQSPVPAGGQDGARPGVRAAALERAQSQKSDQPSSPASRDKDKDDRAQDRPLAGWDKNHAFLRSADGNFETQFVGYGQLDFRGYQSGDAPPNTFLVRRVRLGVEGKIHRYYDYKLEADLADTAGTVLRDFFVRVHRIDELQLSFGQFRVPISQEEIRSDAFQDFIERSMVNNLAPSRSPGVMASGVIKDGVFEYQVGTFNGKGLLAANNNDTPESAIRLRFAPWRNGKAFWTRGLIFGGAYTQGRSTDGLSVRGQTESRSFTFFSPDATNGQYIRANGELTWLLGPAALRAEYLQTNQDREGLGPGGSNLPGVVAKGYMASFTYLLTGEPKPEAGAVVPRSNLFGDETGGRGLGAWEVKFRYANLQIADSTSKSNRAESFYFGPNLYLNRFVRYMLDFGFERFKDPLRSPRPGDNNFFVVLSRIQVAF